MFSTALNVTYLKLHHQGGWCQVSPMLPGSALKFPSGGGGFLHIIKSLPTRVEAELGCDNNYIIF